MRIKAEETAVVCTSLRTQCSRQLRPTPLLIAGQEDAQAQADRIEGRGTFRSSEALAQKRSPGAEVKQTQDQLKGVQMLEVHLIL